MDQKTFFQVTGIIFTVIAVLHLLRLVLGWEVLLGGLVVPVWVSFVGVAIAAYLAYSAYKFIK